MNRALNIIKKIVKVILWIALVLVVLFLIIAGVVQIPAVQTRIVHAATSFVSDKTNTKVVVDHVSISFPKSVLVEGVFLEDLNKDTLLYAQKLKVNIALADLLANKITVNSLLLEGVHVNVHSTATDSLFNYNFLLTAFADSTQQAAPEDTTKSAWQIYVNRVQLKNIRIKYNDRFGGMNAALALENLALKMETFDLEKMVFDVDKLLVEKLNAQLLITKKSDDDEQTTPNTLPFISAKNIQIKNSKIAFADSVTHQSVDAHIVNLKLKQGNIDLNSSLVDVASLYLADSKIAYLSAAATNVEANSEPTNADQNKQNYWKVALKKVELEDNALTYEVKNTPVINDAFDINHLQFSTLNLIAQELYYGSDKTEATVVEFSATDKNDFSIAEFSTFFSMTDNSIVVDDLIARTQNSIIEGDASMRFESLATLTENLPNTTVNIDMKKMRIQNDDVLYFMPEMRKIEFLSHRNVVSTFSGTINGKVKHLVGRNIRLTTGNRTSLKTNFDIWGLPNVKTARFEFPNLRISSGKTDIKMLAGASIPTTIDLPEKIDMKVNFKGKITDFITSIDMNSSFGSVIAKGSIDKNEKYKIDLAIPAFDVGKLMKNDSLFGNVSLEAQVDGKGLDPEHLMATIDAKISEIYLNQYNYHNLTVDGSIDGREVEGKVKLDDKNAAFEFDGLVNLTPKKEQYTFGLNVEKMDLKKLNITEKDLRISFSASTDLKGGRLQDVNGKVRVGKMMLAHDGKRYKLDSLLVASINQPQRSEINFTSALVALKYSGTLSPVSLPSVLTDFVNSYFPVSDTKPTENKADSTNFKFEIQMHNHPILSEVFLPNLKAFDPGLIKGSFNRETKKLLLEAKIRKLVYGSIDVSDLLLDVKSDEKSLNYKISTNNVSNAQINLDNFLFEGMLANNVMTANVSSVDGSKKKLWIQSEITKNNDNFRLAFHPTEFYLMDNRWDIAPDNYLEFGEKGVLIHKLFMNSGQQQIHVASLNNRFNDEIEIDLANFKLDDLSKIVEKDSSLVKGTVGGKILLKPVNNSYGIVADARIDDLFFKNIAIGDLVVKADNPTTERFNLDVKLTGNENDLAIAGHMVPNGGNESLNIDVDINSLSLKTVQAFSMGEIEDASGVMRGNFAIKGSTTAPQIAGKLNFSNAFLTPKILNNKLELKNETVEIKPNGIYFNSFTLRDPKDNSAVIDGNIQMKNFSDFIFALSVNSKNFMLFNSRASDTDSNFFGRMIVDTDIDISGPMSLPVVNAKVKLKKGSNFTFVVPEDKLTTDKGEDVVEFIDTLKANDMFYVKDEVETKADFLGIDLSSIIEVDKEATLKLLMDPTSADSLVVRGEAALSFTMDKSGKMSLTGAYNLNEGSYLVSLESVVKKRFEIEQGSSIIWNGDPMDANISIDATYSVRATPIDLVANQMAGATEADMAAYKQPYPFFVVLKLRGAILKPEISFEINLAPEDKGILGGAVNQKLILLNEDPSALNKQVFALLVLGRFVQENPMESASGGGTESLLRSTVSNFLSAQLNRLSSRVMPGVEMNFDIQSYNDYQTGQAEGRTQVEIGLKKQLFNDRLSVEIGGKVDVEGAAAQNNAVSDIASDVTVEYKLGEEGNYRIKAFRQNFYEGAIDGQLVETGVGFVFVKDFHRFGHKKKNPAKKENDSEQTQTKPEAKMEENATLEQENDKKKSE